MTTTARDIQAALARYLRWMERYAIVPNVCVLGSPWESDVITVTKAGYWHEYEVKLSVQCQSAWGR